MKRGVQRRIGDATNQAVAKAILAAEVGIDQLLVEGEAQRDRVGEMTLKGILRLDDRGTIGIVDAAAICIDEYQPATGVSDGLTGGNSAAVQAYIGCGRDGLRFGLGWLCVTYEIGGLIQRPVAKAETDIVGVVVKRSECAL